MKKSVLICVLMLISMPALSHRDQPLDVLKKSIEEGIRILKDPRYQDGTQNEQQKERLREVSRAVFDFGLFAKLVLGSNWANFAPQQRKEFVAVFSTFLTDFYLSKLQEKYQDEEIIYVGQDLMADSKALVRLKVLWKGHEVPVEVRMVRRGGRWRAYDISALGISAVRIYRAQFKVVLLKDSPAQVIERIKNKIEQRQKRSEELARESLAKQFLTGPSRPNPVCQSKIPDCGGNV